jgi:adenylyltransferase/sulfurtransferase
VTNTDRSEGSILVDLAESRYDRQQRVAWWDQARLARARVLVVGAGALGNEVVKNLVLIGVGNIVVVDGDIVESSNLARCIFFRSEDEGESKAIALARRASSLNPDVTISGVPLDVRSLGSGIALRADVMVGALDNREARLYLNRLAARAGRAWVDGAIEALSGVARVFRPPDVCYECTLTEADWLTLAHRQSCRLLTKQDMQLGKVPTTATTSSIVAGIESQEVVKLIHEDRPGVLPLRGGIVFDGANNDAYPLTYPIDPNCMAHHRYVDPVAISLDSATFEEVTFSAIAQRAWPELSDLSAAHVTIDLGDDQVVGWKCTNCGNKAPESRPASLVAWGDGLCPECGEARQPEVVTSVQIPGPYSDATALSFGIRSDEILSISSGSDERFVWLQLCDTRLPSSWSGQAVALPSDRKYESEVIS